MKDKKENIDGSLLRNSPVRTHVERRVKLNDTNIKKLRAKDENIFKRPLLINL